MIAAFYRAALTACPHLNLQERLVVAINTANAALIGRWS
jgi:hypothetical protein